MNLVLMLVQLLVDHELSESIAEGVEAEAGVVLDKKGVHPPFPHYHQVEEMAVDEDKVEEVCPQLFQGTE